MAKKNAAYTTVPLTFQRKMVAASIAPARQQNNIQALMEVDITELRRFIREHRQATGEKLSLTAFVIRCLAQTVCEHPQVNAFIKGNQLIKLEDVTISAMLEREIDGERVPEPIGIRAAQHKSYRQIQAEIREAQQKKTAEFGGLNDMTWVKFIPGFLLKTFVKLASRNVAMMSRYGVIGVTSVGMFATKNEALWLIPLVAGATVEVAVGGIVERLSLQDGEFESREYLCLTVVFNHDIVDGAPAARFLRRFSELLKQNIGFDEAAAECQER